MGLLGTLTIALGAAVSSGITLPRNKNQIKILIETPVAWTAANMKFQVRVDGTNWINVTEADNTLILLTNIPTAARKIAFAPADADGKDYLADLFNALPNNAEFRVVSTDTADDSDENQAAARTIKIYGFNTRFSL